MTKINKNGLTKEMIEKAMQCKTADKLLELAEAEGYEMTREEAEAYMAEINDFQLDDEVMNAVAGGVNNCYMVDGCAFKCGTRRLLLGAGGHRELFRRNPEADGKGHIGDPAGADDETLPRPRNTAALVYPRGHAGGDGGTNGGNERYPAENHAPGAAEHCCACHVFALQCVYGGRHNRFAI